MGDERSSNSPAGDLQQAARDLVADYEGDRARVARVLHDRVGQALGSVVLNLELGGDVPLDESIRAELLDELRGAIALLRDLSLSLRPALLDECGLADALRSLVQRQSDTGGRPLRFEAGPGIERAGTSGEIVAYRLAQMALEAAGNEGRDAPLLLRLDRTAEGWSLQLEGENVGAIAPRLEARARLFGGRCQAHGTDRIGIGLPVG